MPVPPATQQAERRQTRPGPARSRAARPPREARRARARTGPTTRARRVRPVPRSWVCPTTTRRPARPMPGEARTELRRPVLPRMERPSAAMPEPVPRLPADPSHRSQVKGARAAPPPIRQPRALPARPQGVTPPMPVRVPPADPTTRQPLQADQEPRLPPARAALPTRQQARPRRRSRGIPTTARHPGSTAWECFPTWEQRLPAPRAWREPGPEANPTPARVVEVLPIRARSREPGRRPLVMRAGPIHRWPAWQVRRQHPIQRRAEWLSSARPSAGASVWAAPRSRRRQRSGWPARQGGPVAPTSCSVGAVGSSGRGRRREWPRPRG
jgi:hypothetical protein